MNKFYDKLLLAIAVLALLAGVGFYVTKSKEVPAGKAQVSTQTADNPYQAVPVPHSTESTAAWPEAGEQSTTWIYDVFTPPKIYIGADGQFTAEGIEPPPPPVPFGLYLVEIKKDPYRIQIEGYIEESKSNSLILLYDEELMKSVRARIGDTVTESAFKILDFGIERVVDPVEGIYKEATAKILDQRSGKKVVLTHGERLFEDEVTVLVRSEEDASVNLELKKVGETFETPLGQYILKEINLEESSITVEKQGNEELEAETKVLTSMAPKAINTTPEPPKNDVSENEGLDFIF